MDKEILVQDVYLEEFVFGQHGESLELSFLPLEEDKPKVKLKCLIPLFVKYQTRPESGLLFVSMVTQETLPMDLAEERLRPLGYTEFPVSGSSGTNPGVQLHIIHMSFIDLDMVIVCTGVRQELRG